MSNGIPRSPAPRAAPAETPAWRRGEWMGLTTHDILARYPTSRTAPLKVLDILITLFNQEHTAKQKTVSFKTRQERAAFLRRFFGDLKARAKFKTLPDPRHLRQCHIQASVNLWRADRLAPATIQTYLSFLRGLANWIGKPGLVRPPAYYGLPPEAYQRHEAAARDKSWSGNHVDIGRTIAAITADDAHVGAALSVIRAFGLRRKEAIMLRPHQCVLPFEATGLPLEQRSADHFIHIKAGSKGGRERFIALDTPERSAAIALAQSVASVPDGHLGCPGLSLAQALRRFNYVLEKFGVTRRTLGVTAHGLRHEALLEQFEASAGEAAPVRGGPRLPIHVAQSARMAVAALAGHGRERSADAYCGSFAVKRSTTVRPAKSQADSQT